MGQYWSRATGRSGSEEGSDPGGGGGAGSCYRYPPKSGHPYFANHFIMGGEKFDSPQPESFLFGENSDLNYLGSKPISFPYPPPQANEPTKTLRSQMNIRKDSVHLVPIKPEETADQEEDGAAGDTSGEDQAAPKVLLAEDKSYHLVFTLDTDVRCAVTIFYFSTEEIHSQGVTYNSTRKDLTSETYEFQRGSSQVFDQPGHVFRPSLCLAELAASAGGGGGDDPASDLISVAVQCVSLEGDHPRQTHITLASIDKYTENNYSIKALKQKLFVDGLTYLLQEIYGLENKSVEAAHKQFSDDDDVDDCGAECVVCMCDLRDTIILPCRHLCLCNACADSLRYQANNCPICRAPFRALLQIRAVQKVGQVTHPALADPDASQQEGIPPGYQCVSLIEALNGPMSLAPAPPAPLCALTAADQPKAGESKSGRSRKSRSGKSRSSRSSTQAQVPSTSAPEATPDASDLPEDLEEEDPGHGEEDGVGDPLTGRDPLSSGPAPKKKGTTISVKYVNEVAESGSAPKSSKDESRNSIDLIDEELANLADVEPAPSLAEKLPSDGPSHPGSSKSSSSSSLAVSGGNKNKTIIKNVNKPGSEEVVTSDVVINELDKEAAAEAAALVSGAPPAAAAEAEEADDETVVVNLASGATRVSLPGTPTSIVSVRSSQDSSSASSFSSTKHLLPKSAGSAVIVKVHPTVALRPSEEDPLEAGEEEEGEEDEDAEDC